MRSNEICYSKLSRKKIMIHALEGNIIIQYCKIIQSRAKKLTSIYEKTIFYRRASFDASYARGREKEVSELLVEIRISLGAITKYILSHATEMRKDCEHPDTSRRSTDRNSTRELEIQESRASRGYSRRVVARRARHRLTFNLDCE